MAEDSSLTFSEEHIRAAAEEFRAFLDGYTAQASDAVTPGQQQASPDSRLYVAKTTDMNQMDRTTLDVDFGHLQEWDSDLADNIKHHYFRLEPALRKVVQNFMSTHQHSFVVTADGIHREFWVSFYNVPAKDFLRDLKTDKLGQLVAFMGTCTRTSEVHPELFIGTFKCNDCGEVVKNVQQQFKYTKPILCTNQTCGNRSKWTLERDQSAFVDWQRAKVQECADEVPAGSLPRTMEVILRNNLVESARAGDRTVFTGTLIVVPDVAAISAPGERAEVWPGRQQNQGVEQGVTGPKFLGVRELTYKLAFMACATQAADSASGLVNSRDELDTSREAVLASMTDAEKMDVDDMMRNPLIYADLARSLAPAVFGAEDIKKAVLLMLLGGVHKQTPEGINLRGDINVAIVGDPSCAKSQILKYVANFLPRAVYTSGKSSSAAGLTASVVKEQDSNEFCIEAGALMLADNGICCIDEFDKMDSKDQVAIHEAMEQQTISLAKAGVQATLTARTAILAAANPMGGRYDRSKPLRYNVALPPAILSRFDLLHIMIDEPDALMDERIANHIVAVHQRRDLALDAPYRMPQIQTYIRFARTIRPELTEEAGEAIVGAYAKLRSEDANPGSSTAYRITVRQLEALVRLSEALARLHCQQQVTRLHVHEAVRLVKHSIMQVESVEADIEDVDMLDDFSNVQTTVRNFRQRNDGEGDGGQGPAQPGDRPSGNGDDDDDDADDDDAAPRGPGAAAQPQRMDVDGAQPAGRTAAEVQAEARAALAAGKQRTRVSQKKVAEVKRLLTRRLLDMQREADAEWRKERGQRRPRRAASEAEAEPEAEPEAEADGEAQPADEPPLHEGVTQEKLIEWYFDYMTSGEQSRLTSIQALQEEAALVPKIIQYLIKREGVIVEIERPARKEDTDDSQGETDEQYNLRVNRQRVLALHPDYSAE